MKESVFDQLHFDLVQGIIVEDKLLYCSSFKSGRSSNELRTTVFLKEKTDRVNVMDVNFFTGIKPWYHPWIEITYPYDFKSDNISSSLNLFDSIIEREIIRLFCESLPPAGKIFVSYESDDETIKGLMRNIPPVLTRLGFLLFKQGCTWFKDWYFPEGGLEGGQKLQGEKSITQEHRMLQLNRLYGQVSKFLSLKAKENVHSSIERRAVERGMIALKKQC
jgi:hypothetical protein